MLCQTWDSYLNLPFDIVGYFCPGFQKHTSTAMKTEVSLLRMLAKMEPSQLFTQRSIFFLTSSRKRSILDENGNTSDHLGAAIKFFPFSLFSAKESFDFIFHHAPRGKQMQFCCSDSFSQSITIPKDQRFCLLRRGGRAQPEMQQQLWGSTVPVSDWSLSVSMYLVLQLKKKYFSDKQKPHLKFLNLNPNFQWKKF